MGGLGVERQGKKTRHRVLAFLTQNRAAVFFCHCFYYFSACIFVVVVFIILCISRSP